MQPINAAPDMNTAAPVQKAAATRARPQRVQFPYASHCSIDEGLKQSIERLARRWRCKEAHVHRMGLIQICSTHDPIFAAEQNRNA